MYRLALAHNIFKLPLHFFEGISKGDVGILVLHMIHHQFMARQREVDAHAKLAPLMFVLVREINTDATRHDVGRKGVQLARMLTRTAFHRIGRLKTVKLYIDRQLHQ